jgi:dTDP-4-dehydrorhamnose reductase
MAEEAKETDLPNPVNAYGKTKLAGEDAIRRSGIPHLVFRTAWVYAMRGRNFLLTILRLATERQELRIVSDQVGASNLRIGSGGCHGKNPDGDSWEE